LRRNQCQVPLNCLLKFLKNIKF